MTASVDFVPYSSTLKPDNSRELYLQSLLEDYLEIFSKECMLPTDSEKYRFTEKVKESLLPSRGNIVDIIKKVKILESIDELLSNPPGFNGIQTSEGLLGNKYIDLGWTEALRRLRDSVSRL